MTPEYKPKERRLVTGRETIGLKPGSEIKLSDPSIKRMIVKEVGEDGGVTVEVHDLAKREIQYTAPIAPGTPIVVLDRVWKTTPSS